MPIGACCATDESGTGIYSGDSWVYLWRPCVTCAAGLASVTEILDNDLSENARRDRANTEAGTCKTPHVKEARGQGLLVGCEYDIPIAVEVKHGCAGQKSTVHSDRRQCQPYDPAAYRHKETDVDELIRLIMRASIDDAAAKY